MRILFVISELVTITCCYPAMAGGFLGDITKQIQFDFGKNLEKSLQDTGKIIERAAKVSDKSTGSSVDSAYRTINMIDAKMLSQQLFAKSNEELFALSVLTNPCLEVDCRGLSEETIRTIILQVKSEKQSLSDADIRRSQAIAAVFSAAMALLSLIISAVSLYRSSTAQSSVKVAQTSA